MKKFAITLFLAFVFTFSLSTLARAEGNLPIGGRSCPPNTACLVDNQVPTQQEEDATILKTVIDYLTQLFG
jgi:hypothetical protein